VAVLWWIGVFVADALFCIPVEFQWNKQLRGHCGNQKLLQLMSPIPWIVTDVVILLMPLPMVRQLHLPFKQKVALTGLFLLGGL
jgi:hypothetical protein